MKGIVKAWNSIPSARMQTRNVRLPALAARAKAVLSGSPIIWNMEDAAIEFQSQIEKNGAVKVADITNENARKALEQLGIEVIKVDSLPLCMSPGKAMLILTIAATLKKEGIMYKHCVYPRADYPEAIQVVRTGSEVQVTQLHDLGRARSFKPVVVTQVNNPDNGYN